MPVPPPDRLVLMGRITRVHGLRGEVKVRPVSGEPRRLLELREAFVGKEPSGVEPVEIETARLQQTRRGPLALLRFRHADDRTAAEAFEGLSVYADQDALQLEDGEVFVHDLLGLPVETEEGEPIGVLRDVLELPAHDVLVIAREGAPDALVPDVPEFVIEADPDAGRIRIRPIEGLLD